ncbi:MAG: polysaccharide biosynthesis C-terminal domain-containing protein [Bacteroidales bacterium]|nr:polysaccharide biosynthesis C-terminal domain-containing protein [Bacteroidales bacterium]
MTNKFKNGIGSFFTHGHQRTVLAKKNIAGSFLIKGANIAIGLLLVPITIDYLEPTKYGIWITLSSIVHWFGFFDIGLGNGLRNRLAVALATGNKELAKTFISTTYAILSIIIGAVLLIFFLINPFLNWSAILNAGEDVVLRAELSNLALIVFTFFCLQFILKLITTILTADQRPAKASLFDFMGKLTSLIIIYFITRSNQGSLLYIGLALSGMPVVVLLTSSIWFFNGKYKDFKPSYKAVDFTKAKDLLNLGIKFFVLQIAVVLLYQTNNIIISQLYGPEQVTPYNVAHKYFSILMMGFTIVMTPFWSAFTEAWVKKEIQWIKNIIRKLIYLWLILFLVAIIMLFSAQWVFRIWVGTAVTVPFTLSILVCLWILLNTWSGIFSQFLNGVGKIRLQMYLGLSAALLNVPLAIFLGRKFGIEGVLLANLIVLSVGIWIYPLQYYRIINHKAKGIFNQ